MVVQISEDDFWLTSCGMYKGPSLMVPTLAKVKPTCVGVAPKHDVFTGDFKRASETIKNLMENAITKDRKGILVPGGKIKFRHVLFEEVNNMEEPKKEDSGTPNNESVPVEYTIEGWPVDFPETEEELRSMRNTHRVNYLNAYNEQG
ncbi:hypothetical protein JOM56_014139 [Amanita muscaria]